MMESQNGKTSVEEYRSAENANFLENPSSSLLNRGDEGVLEGVTIADDNGNGETSSDSEDETGITIHAGRVTPYRRSSHYKTFGSKSYQRHQSMSRDLMNNTAPKALTAQEKLLNDELKKLRFSRHVSAFDIDLNALEDHPWRNKNVDLLDYFNYGFNERTWMQYCEKQLRLRAKLGFGPHTANTPAPSTTTTTAINAVSATAAPASFFASSTTVTNMTTTNMTTTSNTVLPVDTTTPNVNIVHNNTNISTVSESRSVSHPPIPQGPAPLPTSKAAPPTSMPPPPPRNPPPTGPPVQGIARPPPFPLSAPQQPHQPPSYGFPPPNHHHPFIMPPPGMAPDNLFMHHHPPLHPMHLQNEMRVRDGENNIEWNFEGDHFLNFQPPPTGEGGYMDRSGPRGSVDGSFRHFNDRRSSNAESKIREDGPPRESSSRSGKDKMLESSRERSRGDSRSRDDYSSKRGEIHKSDREKSSRGDKGERGNKERDYKENSSGKEKDSNREKDRERDRNREKDKEKDSRGQVERKGHNNDKESTSRKRKSRSRSSSLVASSKRKGLGKERT